MRNPKNAYHQIKTHSMGLGTIQDTVLAEYNPASRYVVVARNIIGDADDANVWAVAMSPQNDTSNEGLEDCMVEQNYFTSTMHTTDIILGGRRMSARDNNSGPEAPNIGVGGHMSAVDAAWQGPYYTSQSLPGE